MLTCLAALAGEKQEPTKFEWKKDPKNKDLNALHRAGEKVPLAVFHDPPDGRPYIHPIMAPDGKGILTEYSPGHHRHQTGLYVGFLKVNGRDFFHNRGKDHFSRSSSGTDGGQGKTTYANWVSTYELLDAKGNPLLHLFQRWSVIDQKTSFILDVRMRLDAKQDVTFGKHDYGGLFLRMPWRQKTGGKAVNSEGDENARAEGKKAKWVDVGMPIEGRKDWGHIAILDHKDNPRHPVMWRVDGQLGVGPAPSRAGEWKIEKGKSATLRYRLVVYTGDMNKNLIEKAWKEFTAGKK